MGKMKKLTQVTIFTLAGLIAIVFIGAGCIQDAVTPTYVDEDAAAWAGVPTRIFLPWTTLWDAKRVAMAINYKLTLEQIKAGHYMNITNLSILAGEELKSVVFDPTGPLSFLLVGGPLFAAGVYGVSKPKDRKEIERLKNGNGTV